MTVLYVQGAGGRVENHILIRIVCHHAGTHCDSGGITNNDGFC